MKHSYIIVDDNHESILNTQATAMRFQNLAYLGYANNYDSAINLILEHQPSLIFLEINPSKKESNLSLNLINELYRYMTVVPKIIVTSKDQSLVFRAMEYGVADYLMKPIEINAFRKAIFKFEKSVSQYSVPNSVVQQQSVPQQALTFSDFLRQEPIQKPIVQEEVVAKNEVSEIPVEETTHEINATDSIENAIEEEFDTKTIETEESTLEEISEEVIEENLETLEKSTKVEETDTSQIVEEIISEETTEIETLEEETVETIEATEDVEETKASEIATETEEETNDDEAITILPGQKVIVEQEQPLVICVKSYGDYRYIDSRDIIYFEADNNSVDIHLKDGEMVTAFKTLKVFESVLPSTQFLRIHNSYIINVNQVARIHTGNSVCYIKNSTVKLPFSKSYKENVELIIHRIASGNYLEI